MEALHWLIEPLFHKLHTSLCDLLATMEVHGMTGRLNAQGFESKHFEIAQLKEILGRIAQRWLQVQKMAEWNQSMFVEGLTDLHNFLEAATKDGKYIIFIHFFSSQSVFILLILLSRLILSRLILSPLSLSLSLSFFLTHVYTHTHTHTHNLILFFFPLAFSKQKQELN